MGGLFESNPFNGLPTRLLSIALEIPLESNIRFQQNDPGSKVDDPAR
jgi:hypothetical protein